MLIFFFLLLFSPQNLSRLDVEPLLLNSIEVESRASLQRIRKQLISSGHFEKSAVTVKRLKERRSDGKSVEKDLLQVQVKEQCFVRLSVNQHTGEIVLSESHGKLSRESFLFNISLFLY